MTAELDEIVSMTVFARVVSARSFTAAALLLGLSKSVVSARVSALEERLGVRLLHRTTRRLSLTDEGARLYEKCAQLIAVADEAYGLLASAKAEPEGLVRVTAPVGFGLLQMPAVLRGISSRYPRLVVELSLSEHRVDIVASGFDVAIRVAEHLDDSALVARVLTKESAVVCAAPAYIERYGLPTSPHDLSRHNCLRLAPLRPEWRLRVGKKIVQIPISGTVVTDNIALLREATLLGLGIARMPRSVVAQDLESGRLLNIFGEKNLDETRVFVMHPYRRHIPTKVRAFVDYLVEHFRGAVR